MKTGVFAPPALIGAMPFAGLRALVDEAIAALEALTPAEVNGWAGKALNIALSRPLDEDDRPSAWAPRQLAFTSETSLLSFSLPNFHFHAVTAYDILRSRGVPLGKRDFEGQLRRCNSNLAQIGTCDTRLGSILTVDFRPETGSSIDSIATGPPGLKRQILTTRSHCRAGPDRQAAMRD